jgi:nicotinamidase-related amidase
MVWVNDGKGSFTDSKLRLGNSNSKQVDMGDINGDGTPDAVVANLKVDRTVTPPASVPSPVEIWLNTSGFTKEWNMKPALMIIDLQKAYYDDETKESMNKASRCINAVIPIFRKKNLPIIWIQHIEKEDGSEPGKTGFDFIDQLQPGAEDYRIHKRYRNTFNKTNSLEIIKKEKIDTVILSGYCAEFCIQGTSVGAWDQDLVPILLKDGIASGNTKNIKFIESINEIISSKALKKLLE